MAQEWAAHFYKSPAWLKNRKAYMMRVIDTPYGPCPPMMCERCFARGKLEPAKLVHHKKHLTPQNIDDPHVTLAYDNLQRLCQDCHAVVHGNKAEMRVTFNADGSIEGPSENDSFAAHLQMLTDGESERRNIYKAGEDGSGYAST